MRYDILLVEDEAVVACDVRHRLERLGYAPARLATNGAEALRMFNERTPDVVLMDIVLDGPMDGIELAGHIRAEAHTPIIYLTGHAAPDILHRAKITEPFGYILEPFEDRELHICIEMAIYKSRVDNDLRAKERWFASTLRSIPDAVVTVDGAGRITYCNDSAERLTHQPRAELLGARFGQSIPLCDALRTDYTDPAALVAPGYGPLHFSDAATLGTPSGSVPVEIRISPLHDANGTDAGAVLVMRDVTERRRAEETLHATLDDLQRAFRQTVSALAATSEKRDPYTAGHQARVAQLACALASRLDLGAHAIEGVRVAAMLHDIGKIHIPSEILAKPTRLSDLEMSIMRMHSEVGHDILREISFPWPVADIVLQHHERLDGSGYPHGLAGDAILPAARIIAVADVVEAMSSHRPYRPARGLGLAFDEIMSGRGARYDAAVVDACQSLFAEGFTFDQPNG